MVMHVGSLRAWLHDTGGRGDFRTGASSPQLMPHWIEDFIPVRNSQISIKTTTRFGRKSASWIGVDRSSPEPVVSFDHLFLKRHKLSPVALGTKVGVVIKVIGREENRQTR